MSVVLYRNGKLKLFTPYEFKDYLEHGWCFSKEESLQNGLRKEREIEVKTEVKTEEVKKVAVVVVEDEESKVVEEKKKRKYFRCSGCGKRKGKFPEDIFYDDENKKYCSLECLNCE